MIRKENTLISYIHAHKIHEPTFSHFLFLSLSMYIFPYASVITPPTSSRPLVLYLLLMNYNVSVHRQERNREREYIYIYMCVFKRDLSFLSRIGRVKLSELFPLLLATNMSVSINIHIRTLLCTADEIVASRPWSFSLCE